PVGEVARRDDDGLLMLHADTAEAHADREHGGGGEAPAQPGPQREHARASRPARRLDPLPHLLAWRVGRAVVVLRRLAQYPIEAVVGHGTQSTVKSASEFRSLVSSIISCDYTVQTLMIISCNTDLCCSSISTQLH